MNASIADIRKDYTLKSLNEEDVTINPFDQFTIWWNEAIDSNIDEVNAMTLATVSKELKPSARIVLLKDYDAAGFTFFTNYNSQKANDLKQNPNATICFFWKELQRQVRIEGLVNKASNETNDEYFNSRPEGSKLGAWASPQSQVIESRDVLIQNEERYKTEFSNQLIPRPPHWGGYKLVPNYFEFWQGRSNRLHDRITYSFVNGLWRINRIAP